jgi:uncharacterized membrane-anchored protein
MGLREATLITLSVTLGLTLAAATADAKPTRPAPKAAKKPAAEPAAERPDPAAGAAGTGAADAKQDGQDGKEADKEAEDVALPPHVVGPKHVELGNNTSIDLPDGMVMFERNEAQELLRKSGNSPDGVVAMVFKPGSDWHVFLEYEDSGYIDDSDANDLDADELLDSYREGTEAQNKTRKSMNQSELHIDTWTEKPRYEKPLHHLVWGLSAHSTEGKVVNFFTRILGRTGYLSVDLIDEPDRLEVSKKEALAILQATRFNAGNTYADHVGSDRSSGVGLRGLVLGGAGIAVASKLGLLAKLLLVFKKAFILIGAAVAGLFRWLFRRKSNSSSNIASSGPPSDPPPGTI